VTETAKVGETREVLPRNVSYQHGELETGVSEEAALVKAPKVQDSFGRKLEVEEVVSGKEKIGRNDPCPCGSGKKYKKCHGK
jgi:uncharacterized protein YecA (UPF0149 family)